MSEREQLAKRLQKPKTLAELKWMLACTANPVTRSVLKAIIKNKDQGKL